MLKLFTITASPLILKTVKVISYRANSLFDLKYYKKQHIKGLFSSAFSPNISIIIGIRRLGQETK